MNKNLLTAQQIEYELGSGYFYRQYIYRLAEEKSVESYILDDKMYFSIEEVIESSLSRLKEKVKRRMPRRFSRKLRIGFYPQEKKEITIYTSDKKIEASVNTEEDSEESLLKKLENTRKEVKSKMPDHPVHDHDHDHDHDHKHEHSKPHHPHGPKEHHHEMMKRLDRIEELLRRIEGRL